MSQIENSRICPIARTLSSNSSQSHSAESTNPFLKTPLRSTHLPASGNSTAIDNTNTTTTTSEKRLNFALQSRKNSSDGRTSGEKNPELKSEAFAHSKNRSNFEFWRSQVESSTVESSRVTSSPQTIQQPLQSAICSVNLGSSGDGTLSADSGVSTTRQPNQQKNVDVEREVESVTPKGGDETAATQDDATTAAAAAEILTEAGSSDIVSAGLKENKQQLLEQQQQQNPKPKPILKRQDVPISIVALPPATTLPPPILKKRDSFSGGSSSSSGINECYSSAQQSCAIHVQNVITSAKPASILKNRQPRGSYSFDENVHVNDVPSSSFDDGAHLLKPILKKKSWSIEEKVAVSTNSSNLNEAVKGILKTSSDKLASFSASSSRKNSAVDELAVLSISSAITQSSSTASPTKATLKGILKTSPKNRSASISPSSSFEALSDDTELDAVPLPPSLPKPTTSAAMFCREVSTQEEEYSPPDVPSSDSIMSYSDFTVQQHQHEQLCNEDSANSQPVPAVAAASSARPALFKTISVHASSDSDSPSGSPLSSSETHTSDCSVSQQQSVPSSQIDDAVNDDDVDDDESPSQESSADTALTSDHESCEETDLSSMNLTVFRPKTSGSSDASSSSSSKSRPKSCLVTSAELLGGKTSLASSSIAQRLALLKQSGEEGWKNRVQKADVEKEIVSTAAPAAAIIPAAASEEVVRLRPKKAGDTGDVGSRGSVITSRLSCLIDSQAQWKSRVGESDAKQFTVASKQNYRHSAVVVTPAKSISTSTSTTADAPQPKMDPTEKVVLRGTPRRLGLRGSTLNESALNAVSSKLNNVLRPDKSMLSGPLSPIRKKADDLPTPSPVTIDAPKLDVKLTKKPNLLSTATSASSSTQPTTVYLPRPDDEDSFGSFFGLDSSKLDHLLKQDAKTADPNLILLDSLPNEPTSLLTHVKRTRVQAPKRRAASSHNPIKQLNKSDISVDSYSHSKVPNSANGHQVSSDTSSKLKASSSAPVEHYAKNNLAISALAGLASKEDFKKVATQLRSSTAANSSGNDTWRQHDLKNSIQSRMLILVKGRRHAQIRLVKPSWRSLNLADSFILVTKDTVFAFVGTYSNIIERSKCIEVADHIRKRREMCYRSVNNSLVLIDGHAETAQERLLLKAKPLLKELDWSEGDKAAWEEMVDAKQTEASADEDDEYFEESQICTNKIFEAVFDEADGGSLVLEPVARYWGRRPVHQLLQPESAFVFDFCFEVYVWLGKYASNTLRQKAVDAAKDLFLQGYDYSNIDISFFGVDMAVKSDKRPDWAWFTRVHQNMEPILFKDKFSNWPAFTLTRSVKTKSQRTALKCDSTKDIQGVKKGLSEELKLFPADVEQMINRQVLPEFQLEGITEEGDFKVLTIDMQCLYINDSGELTELDGNSLYTGESYCIRWKYRINRITRSLTGGESKYSDAHGGRDRLLYFLWVGRNARALDSCTTALHAVEKVREEGADQMMIENGKEFPAFLRIFDGSLVILLGKRIQGSTEQKYRMFSLKSVKTDEMFLSEVECSSRNLRSRSSFLFTNVSSSKVIYIWHGCKAPPVLRKLIRQFLEEKLLASKPTEFGFTKRIGQFDVVELEEGKESKEFINLLNGSVETSSPKRTSRLNLQRDIYFSLLDDDRPYDFTPRLFHFTTSASRVFQATEVVPSYMPNRESTTFLDYPFTQEDLYLSASTRPTFFLLDNHYEVYLWESKFPFYIPGLCSSADKLQVKKTETKTSAKPRMIDIETEILSEVNLTTGSLAQLWLAERKCALETTLAYCHAKNSSEPPTAYVISAGLEPHSFCGLFPTWNYYENVAQLHIDDGRKPGQQILVQEVLAELRDIHTASYSYEVLKKKPLPEGINTLCLESYLDDAEFEKVFGFNREEFYALPAWKILTLKKEKELF